VDLVVPEQLGSVVTIAKSSAGKKGLLTTIRYPAAPGLYRLVVTVHTESGVAYDAATQGLLTPVLVRVGGPVAVAWGTPAAVALTAGAEADLAVRIVNAGSRRWDAVVAAQQRNLSGESGGQARTTTLPAQVVATWVSVDGQAVPDSVVVRLADSVAEPGGEATATLGLIAPAAPGTYLLLLDVLTPTRGPLSALGNAPALIRVTVAPAVATSAPVTGDGGMAPATGGAASPATDVGAAWGTATGAHTAAGGATDRR
jgi:hypothetical protein